MIKSVSALLMLLTGGMTSAQTVTYYNTAPATRLVPIPGATPVELVPTTTQRPQPRVWGDEQILSTSLSAPKTDAERIKEGFTLFIDEQGRKLWRRRVDVNGKPLPGQVKALQGL